MVLRYRRWYGLWRLGPAWVVSSYPLVPGTPVLVDAALLVLALWLVLQGLRSVVWPRVAAAADESGLTLGTRRLPWEAIRSLGVGPALLGPRLRAETTRRWRRAEVAEPWVAGGIDELVEAVKAVHPVAITSLPPTPAHRARIVLVPLVVVALLLVLAWAYRSMVVPGAWAVGPGHPVEVHERLRGAEGDAGGDVLVLTTRDHPAPPSLIVRSLFDDVMDLRWRSPIGVALTDPGATRHRDAATDAAVVAAFRCLGRPLAVRGGGVEVGTVDADSRAAGLVEEGERIVAVDGIPVRFKEDVYAVVDGREGGERAMVELEGNGRRHTEALRVVGVEGTTVLAGVEVRRRPLELGRLERAVALDLDDIEGDSAGLAVALTLVDVLETPYQLPPLRVAVTGSVSPEGVVGPVGSVRYKVVGARRAGASVLLVPSSQLALAQRYAGEKLRVVGVQTLHEGLEALGMPGCDG